MTVVVINNNIKVSICIPTYEMYDKGVDYLKELFDSINTQTYNNIEVVVSDHSTNTKIEEFVNNYNTKYDVVYIKNEKGRGNSSINMNCAITSASGHFIKIMHQDDIFSCDDAIELMVDLISEKNANWGVFAFNHIKKSGDTPYNYISNQHGCPSTTFFKNDNIFFNESLIYINDADIHKRLQIKYGEPFYILKNCVTIRMHNKQVTHTLITPTIKFKELKFFRENIY